MQNLSERFSFLIDSTGLSINEFVQSVGGTSAKYYRIMRSEVKPSHDTYLEISKKFPDISLDWLINGRGKPFFEKDDRIEEKLKKDIEQLEVEIEMLKREKNIYLNVIEKLSNSAIK
jgi:transcriptional regulator with XRE-family HTH domain